MGINGTKKEKSIIICYRYERSNETMKKFWKHWLCVALVVTILAVFPIPTLGEEDAMEWTYDNSIVVTINTDTPQQFTPEDFPGR